MQKRAESVALLGRVLKNLKRDDIYDDFQVGKILRALSRYDVGVVDEDPQQEDENVLTFYNEMALRGMVLTMVMGELTGENKEDSE